MDSAAIICEYNPFHKGHEYQIKALRALFPEPIAVVAVMSGSFTQRGEPAIFDKYARAESALDCGVDLVLELPAPYSMSPAQLFAAAGVAIAESVGVDYLAFGSELGALEPLLSARARLDSPEFAEALETARTQNPILGAGALRAGVYRELYGDSSALEGSNDLLALEYLRALERTKIQPIAIKRLGERYNPTSDELPGFASASSVRRAIFAGERALDALPEPSRRVARRELDARRCYRSSSLDTAVTAFLRFSHESMRGCAEVGGGIENRLHEAALHHATLDEIVAASLERNYSASRLRRAIFSGMLGFTHADCIEPPAYTSLLGANSVGRELLSKRRKSGFVLTKSANYTRLSPSAAVQFERNLRAEALAALACGDPDGKIAAESLRRSPIVK